MTSYVPIGGVPAEAFRWVHVEGLGPTFDLFAGDQAVGRLYWTKPHGSLAEFDSAAGNWTLKRAGFLNPHVTSRGGDPAADRARLSAHLTSSAIELPDGSHYALRRSGLLVPGWELRFPSGKKAVDMEPVADGRRLAGGLVSVAPAAQRRPELLDLLVITWYFIVLAWFEDEAAEVAAGVVATFTAASG